MFSIWQICSSAFTYTFPLFYYYVYHSIWMLSACGMLLWSLSSTCNAISIIMHSADIIHMQYLLMLKYVYKDNGCSAACTVLYLLYCRVPSLFFVFPKGFRHVHVWWHLLATGCKYQLFRSVPTSHSWHYNGCIVTSDINSLYVSLYTGCVKVLLLAWHCVNKV